jgi:hypothetical protein
MTNKPSQSAKGVQIASDIFDMDLKPPGWAEDPDLRKAVNWFLTFLPPNEWKQRRLAALQRFLDSVTGAVASPGKGRFFDEKDQFAWYLFLGQAFLEHPTLYDFTFGCRVIPVLTAIGRNLDLLVDLTGVETRVRRMIHQEKGQPNACLFELLVAAAYRRRGAAVKFLEERPGLAKTHDMDVLLDGTNWAVECKRLELGEYTEQERSIARELWMPVARALYERGLDVICNAHFLVELSTVPKNYFALKSSEWMDRGGIVPLSWSDRVGVGEIRRLDLMPLKKLLETDDVAMNSSRLHQLLTGEYKRYATIITTLRVKFADNPIYIDTCEAGTVFDWESRSEAAIDGKARDVLKRLADGSNQLPDGTPSIVHIGLEAVNGLEVEKARYRKVMKSISDFDPGTKQLEYVYVNWFAPESPPQEPAAFDETCLWQGVRPTRQRPLAKGFLVLSPESESRAGVHWQPPKP